MQTLVKIKSKSKFFVPNFEKKYVLLFFTMYKFGPKQIKKIFYLSLLNK